MAPLVVAAAVATACSSAATVVPPGAVGPPPVALADLPPCQPPAPPSPAVDHPGVLLPPGGYLTAIETDGPLTTANGWAPATPVRLRAFYADPPRGWEPMTLEDEVVEAEVLLRSREHRLFVQAIAECPTGSHLYVRVLPESVAR